MDFLQNNIAIEVTPSKFVRRHSVSVENTLMRRHSVGPGSKAKDEERTWRGDHTFNSDAASFSLLNFIEPEIEATNPYLSKKEVHTLALERFEHRLKQDLSFEHQENSHIDTTVHWKIIEGKNSKKEFATEYGGEMITLSKLWEHTRTYAEYIGNPLAYNREEERAQLAMQDAFIGGNAQGFVSVISHPDAIRYVQVWEKTTTGDIASKQIDLFATTGRDFSYSEAQALVDRITKYHETHGTSTKHEDIFYAHVLLTSGVIAVDDIKTIAVAHACIHKIDATLHKNDFVTSIAIKTAADVKDTAFALGHDFHTFVQKRIEVLKETFIEKISSHMHGVTISTVAIQNENVMHQERSVEKVQKNIEKIYEASKTPVEDALSEWVFEHTVLSYGVLDDALSVSALSLLARETNTLLVERNASIPIGARMNEDEKVYEALDVHTTIASVHKFLYTILGVTFNESSTTKEQENILQEYFSFDKMSGEHSSVETSIVFIMRALSFFIQEAGFIESQKDEKECIADTTDNPEDRADVYKIVHRVLFGIVIWMILQGFDQGRNKKIFVDGKTSTNVEMMGTKNTLEYRESFSTTPWILFSIIWYLSMLREGGVSQTPVPPQPIQFPLSAIIYTYS